MSITLDTWLWRSSRTQVFLLQERIEGRPQAFASDLLVQLGDVLAVDFKDECSLPPPLYKNWSTLGLADLPVLANGFVTAFLSALLVVKTLVGFVSRNGFAPFAYYRLVVGLATLR